MDKTKAVRVEITLAQARMLQEIEKHLYWDGDGMKREHRFPTLVAERERWSQCLSEIIEQAQDIL